MKILNLSNPFGAGKIYYKEQTGSTMADAKALIPDHPESGTVVTADEQVSGRGRVEGRKWLGGKGESLMFTVLINESDISFFKTLFPLYAGYCVMKFLQDCFSIKGLVKWPNDVLVNGDKISGILCENTDSYIMCGIGLNLNQQKFPDIDGRKAVSLYQLTGDKYNPSELLVKLLKTIYSELDSVLWKNTLEEKLYLKGENAVLSEGIPGKSERIEGQIKGIGDYGQLIFMEKGSGEIRNVYSGEIF